MNMKKLSAVLLAVMQLGGCQTEAQTEEETTTVTETAAPTYSEEKVSVSAIKAKYEDTSGDASVMPLYNVAPDEKFDFSFNYNLTEDYTTDDYVTVHTDAKCLPRSKIYTYADYTETDNGGCILTVSPISAILETEADEQDYFENDHAVWGNVPVYYIAIWYDTEAQSLVKLDEPVVIPFTVKHEVPAPEVRGVVDSNGCFSLQWEPVEGAEEYRVYTLKNSDHWTGHANPPINGAENGYSNCSLLFEEAVTDTIYMNFDGSGDNVNRFERNVSGREYIIGQNHCVNGEYYVSAVIDGKESGFARAVTTAELKIPYVLTDECDIMFERYDDLSKLPLTLDVINIDGSITSRNVMYTFQMEKTYLEGVLVPEYAYAVEGTAITGCISLDIDSDYDFPETIGSITPAGYSEPKNNIKAVPDADVESVAAESDEGTLIERQLEGSEKHRESGNDISVSAPDSEIMIFADSPEEEWLALNLAGGEREISLEAFPSLQIFSGLEDAINKVYYQNPYILGVYEYSYDYSDRELKVKYVYDKEEISSRQQEITAAADKIISEVITEGMSEEEKQLAIYGYLEKNSSYDYEALEDAKKNNFIKTADADYEDSFNAYGILVNGKGVCQSYACAYKLLCSKSGIECNVVTGYLNGSLPHAWNNISIDGGWYQTDITNNGNITGIPYYLYNADTLTAENTGYTEDKLYGLDNELDVYFSDEAEYEYYHANNLCASDMSSFRTILTAELKRGADPVCIRWTGEMPEQTELVKAVSEVYYGQNREDELTALKMGMANSFIILTK